MLSKHPNYSKSVGEIEYYYDEAIKYLKSDLEETIAKRVKLNPGETKKAGTGVN